MWSNFQNYCPPHLFLPNFLNFSRTISFFNSCFIYNFHKINLLPNAKEKHQWKSPVSFISWIHCLLVVAYSIPIAQSFSDPLIFSKSLITGLLLWKKIELNAKSLVPCLFLPTFFFIKRLLERANRLANFVHFHFAPKNPLTSFLWPVMYYLMSYWMFQKSCAVFHFKEYKYSTFIADHPLVLFLFVFFWCFFGES